MAKWGLWTAHRYMWAGASVPRTIGPDGRPLRRPWRQRSDRAVGEAERIRAMRRQPVWPRVFGWACIGIAMGVALRPMTWVSSDVGLSAAAPPVPEPRRPAIAIPELEHLATAGAFRWQPGPSAGPFRFVLLAEDYQTLATHDGIEGLPWHPEQEVLSRLEPGVVYHAYLVAPAGGRLVKSPLTTFVWH